MDKTLRSILWVLVVLVLLSSFSAGWFFVTKEKLYNEYMDLENLFKTSMERLNREIASSNKRNMELATALKRTEEEMRILESKTRDLESEHEELLRERDDLNRELARVKKGKFFIEKKLRNMESDKFIAGLLREKVSLEVELNRLKDSLIPEDSGIEGLRQENTGLNGMVSSLTEEKRLLEQRLEDSTEVAEILSMDLLRLKDKAEEERREFEDIRVENRLSKTRLSELEDITDRFNKLSIEKKRMELRISGMEDGLKDKKQEIDKLRLALRHRIQDTEGFRAEAYHSPAEVELPPIIVQRGNYGAETLDTYRWMNDGSALKGRIVTVNREHNFVVVDLGRQDGIKIGTRFDVYKGDFTVGSIEVIQARERIAACDIVDLRDGNYIEVDDIIVKR